MRVALIAPPFESVPPLLYGGTERVVAHIAQGLALCDDVDVTVFASADSRLTGKIQLAATCPKALRLEGLLGDAAIPIHFATCAQVAHRIKADDFDVIHNHHDLWMLPLSEISERPFFTTLHGRLDIAGLEDCFSKYPRGGFISISDSQKSFAPRVPWVGTIHHGIPVQDYQFNPTPGKYLAFLGRISEEKRPEWAIQIAKKAGIPLKIAAKVEGKAGEEYFNSRIKPHLDGKNVEFIGEINDHEKSDFLGNALGLVFPIDWPEPFGLVMVEALACGTPVLARPCGSVPEIIEHGLTGYLSMHLDVLSSRVRDLELLDRRICRQQAVHRFSLRRMSEDYLHVYRKSLSAPSARSRTASHRGDFHHSLERTDQRNPQAECKG